jgi:hypothetical protein
MIFREHTELQEQSQNTAHPSAITHRGETNGWDQLEYSARWITAGNGSHPEMDHRRWITGDGSWETDVNLSPSLLRS